MRRDSRRFVADSSPPTGTRDHSSSACRRKVDHRDLPLGRCPQSEPEIPADSGLAERPRAKVESKIDCLFLMAILLAGDSRSVRGAVRGPYMGGSWAVRGSGSLGCELRNLLSRNNFSSRLAVQVPTPARLPSQRLPPAPSSPEALSTNPSVACWPRNHSRAWGIHQRQSIGVFPLALRPNGGWTSGPQRLVAKLGVRRRAQSGRCPPGIGGQSVS
jgi:hypothetical protein